MRKKQAIISLASSVCRCQTSTANLEWAIVQLWGRKAAVLSDNDGNRAGSFLSKILYCYMKPWSIDHTSLRKKLNNLTKNKWWWTERGGGRGGVRILHQKNVSTNHQKKLQFKNAARDFKPFLMRIFYRHVGGELGDNDVKMTFATCPFHRVDLLISLIEMCDQHF